MSHGFFSPGNARKSARTFDGEIAATRAMLRRAIAFYPRDLSEAVRALDLFGRATMRLKRLILLERELKANLQETEFEQALEQALREIAEEWKSKAD